MVFVLLVSLLLSFFGFCFVLTPYAALKVILVWSSGPDEMEQTLLPDEIWKCLQSLWCSKLTFPTPQNRPGWSEVVRISKKKYTLRAKGSDSQQAKPYPSPKRKKSTS